MIDERELDAAVQVIINYKGDLAGQRSLQSAGFAVSNTKGSELTSVFDGASRRAISALGHQGDDLAWYETLGELLLNHVRGAQSRELRRNS